VVWAGGRAGRGHFAPFSDGEGANVFVGAGEVCGDGQASGGAAGGEEGSEELVVTIWGFDKELSTVRAGGFGFEVSDGCGSGGAFDGEVAVEFELLAVEAASHEGEEDGTGADEGADGGAVLVGEGDEELAGVGDAGAAGFGEDTDGLIFYDFLPENGLHFFFFGFMDGIPFIIVNNHFFPEGFQVTACGALVFDEEDGAGFDGVEDIGGEGGEGMLVEESRDEVDGRGWHSGCGL